jgi:hypothetical protein
VATKEMPLSVILIRLFTPLLILGVYWWARLFDLLDPGADGWIGVEWAVACVATLVGLVVTAEATYRLYVRIVGDEGELADE